MQQCISRHLLSVTGALPLVWTLLKGSPVERCARLRFHVNIEVNFEGIVGEIQRPVKTIARRGVELTVGLSTLCSSAVQTHRKDKRGRVRTSQQQQGWSERCLCLCGFVRPAAQNRPAERVSSPAFRAARITQDEQRIIITQGVR